MRAQMPAMVAQVVLKAGGDCHRSIVEVAGCTLEMTACDTPDVKLILLSVRSFTGAPTKMFIVSVLQAS